MAFKVEGEARVAFVNEPGVLPVNPPDNGELKVQQADGLLVTRQADGSPRYTDLRPMPEQILTGPLADALANVIGREGPPGPKGDRGVQGLRGEIGPQGERGLQGFRGDAGPQGLQGVQGDRGLAGDAGPQGAQGERGLQGSAGTQGTQGERGLQGLRGDAGPQGTAGAKGEQGLQGPQGADGPQGDRGLQGTAGAQGPQGLTGTQGPQGLAGAKGEVGAQGLQGAKGDKGDPGFGVYSTFVPAGQNSFTVPGGYRAGYIDVYKDQTWLVPDRDYTATNGASIALADASIGLPYTVISQSTDLNTTRVLTDKFGSKLINYRQAKFDIRDEGAAPGGGCAASIAEATRKLNRSAAGGTIIVNGAFTSNEAITLLPAEDRILNLVGDGVMSSIAWSGTGVETCLNLVCRHISNRVRVENLSLRAGNTPNLARLAQIRGGGYYQSISVERLYIEGSATANPGVFLEIVNPLGANVSDVFIEGARGGYGAGGGIGLYVYANASFGAPPGVDFVLDNIKINRVGTGIRLDGTGSAGSRLEGAMLRDCILVGVQNGLEISAPGQYFPGLAWVGGHINCQKYGMVLNNLAQFRVFGALFYMDLSNSPIAFINNTGCKDISVENNLFNMVDQNATGQTNIACYGIFDSNSSGTSAVNNKFNMLTADAPLFAAAGSTRFTYGMNEKMSGGGLMAGFATNANQIRDKGGNIVW